jgi:hypothetical protein
MDTQRDSFPEPPYNYRSTLPAGAAAAKALLDHADAFLTLMRISYDALPPSDPGRPVATAVMRLLNASRDTLLAHIAKVEGKAKKRRTKLDKMTLTELVTARFERIDLRTDEECARDREETARRKREKKEAKERAAAEEVERLKREAEASRRADEARRRDRGGYGSTVKVEFNCPYCKTSLITERNLDVHSFIIPKHLNPDAVFCQGGGSSMNVGALPTRKMTAPSPEELRASEAFLGRLSRDVSREVNGGSPGSTRPPYTEDDIDPGFNRPRG